MSATENQSQTDPAVAEKDAMAEAVMAHAAFDGWTGTAMAAGARDLGKVPEEARRLFPGGAVEIVDWIDRRATERMLEALAARDFTSLKIREKISLAIRLRLEPMTVHREALRRATSLMALPFNAPQAASALYRTVDAMWYGIGDRSTDFNFYSKRAILAGVFASTVLVWLYDRSEGQATTWAFLDRRIADVMRFEKAKASWRDLLARGPFAGVRPQPRP
ncbi:MAG: COQ9 family protein [Reyranellaceae bacterium]